MKLQKVKLLFQDRLSSYFSSEELMSFFYQLVEYYLGEQRFILHLTPEYEIDESQWEQFSSAIEALEHQQPIQYIIGETEFLSLRLKVNDSVLIPRPETEDLILYLETFMKNNEVREVLDIGTGSGCIGLSLKQRLIDANVSLMDVSSKALEVAKINAELNNLELEFQQADVLELKTLDQTYDLIVSNPPYVRDLEKAQMQSNVLDYEPHLALFVSDEDPLLFYRKIAKLAKEKLNPGGMLCFEINEAFGKETVDLLKQIGFKHIELIQDRYNKDRIVSAIQ